MVPINNPARLLPEGTMGISTTSTFYAAAFVTFMTLKQFPFTFNCHVINERQYPVPLCVYQLRAGFTALKQWIEFDKNVKEVGIAA